MTTVHIVGVPMDLGQARRGVDMGPYALRYAGLGAVIEELGYQVVDGGNIPVPVPEEEEVLNPRARHLRSVAATCEEIYRRARACREAEGFILFLGGDHSISIGTVAAVAEHRNIGLIWVDAHGDFNTPETTPSGNIHGMPVAVLTGRGPDALVNVGFPGPKVKPPHIVLIGTRDLDPPEREALRQSGITIFTMRDIDELGMATVARRVIAHLHGLDYIHLSLDMDALDPDIAPGVGTPVPGGLTYREAHLLMEILAEWGKIGSLDVVEVNPILDRHNQTARMAVELTASLLGKRIL